MDKIIHKINKELSIEGGIENNLVNILNKIDENKLSIYY